MEESSLSDGITLIIIKHLPQNIIGENSGYLQYFQVHDDFVPLEVVHVDLNSTDTGRLREQRVNKVLSQTVMSK